MSYPTELVEKAKYEVHVFERVSADTGIALIAEVERLRAEIAVLTQQRIEWRCHVAGETFRTDDKDVAEEWKSDGLDVDKYVLLPNACGEPGLTALSKD